MTRKTLAMVMALGAAGLAPCLLAEGGNQKMVQSSSTQTVPFQPGGTIRLEHSFGDLSIEGWDRPEVEITVVTTLSGLYDGKDQAAAAKRAEAIKVTAGRHSDSELEISTAAPHYSRFTHPFGSTSGVTVEYQIHAPRDSKLVIHHGAGEVMLSNMTSDIEASGSSGDIVVLLPEAGKYAIDAKSNIGTVTSDFDGDFHRRKLTGIQYSDSDPAAGHKIHLRMGVGGITIKSSPPSAQPPAITK